MLQEKNNITITDVIALKFAQAELPVFKTEKKTGYQTFGLKNDYPSYVLSLYENSTKHSAILKGKITYVAGGGIKSDTPNDMAEKWLEKANPYESWNDLNQKFVSDLEIFNGFYAEVLWNQKGEVSEVYHLDFSSVRTNEDCTQFWVHDWTDTRKKELSDAIPAFNPENPTGKQIIFIKAYQPNRKTYPLPNYLGSLNYIEADVLVSQHLLSLAKVGFTPSKQITIPSGDVPAEKKRALQQAYEKAYTGSSGAKFLLSFVHDITRKTIIDDLGQSDLTKEDFSHIDKLIQQNIFSGHQITSQDLFGISTEGALGSRNALRDAYEIFNNTYVAGRQRIINEFVTALSSYAGIANVTFSIIPTEPIGYEFSEAIITANMTQDEIRTKLGLEPLPTKTSSSAKDIIDGINSLSPLVANKVLESMSSDEIRALVGLASLNTPATPVVDTQMSSNLTNDQILGIFAEYGEEANQYESLDSFDIPENYDTKDKVLQFAEDKINLLQANILELMKNDELINIEAIAKALNTEEYVVSVAVKDLVKRDIINFGTGINKILKPLDTLEAPKPTILGTKIMYKYDWKPSIPTGERNSADHPSREFCSKMMGMNKYYTRADIEKISARLGYSVFDRRGGWWTQPNGYSSPSCRHIWQNVVIRTRN